MEGEWESKCACLWQSTGSAPWCSCHGNSTEYSFFFLSFLHIRSSLSSKAWKRNRETNRTRRDDERPKDEVGQKDRGIEDEHKKKIRNEKREEIGWCGITAQRKCQTVSPPVEEQSTAAHRDKWGVLKQGCRPPLLQHSLLLIWALTEHSHHYQPIHNSGLMVQSMAQLCGLNHINLLAVRNAIT